MDHLIGFVFGFGLETELRSGIKREFDLSNPFYIWIPPIYRVLLYSLHFFSEWNSAIWLSKLHLQRQEQTELGCSLNLLSEF